MSADADNRFEQLVEDYATEPVPNHKTVGGLRIGLVLAGIGIALPSLFSGAQIGNALGLSQSITAFIAAGIFVSLLGLVSGLVGSKTRLSTYMIIQFSFGTKGSNLVNIAFALSQFGWFGVNTYLFAEAAQAVGTDLLGWEFGRWVYVAGGGFLMTVSTIFGFKALDKLALFAVPLLMATLVYMISQTLGVYNIDDLLSRPGAGDLTLPDAISALAGGIMVGVVLLPDLTRYARSSASTVIAVIISLTIVEPLVHLAGAMPAIGFGLNEVLPILLAVGLGAFALFIMGFGSWTSNAVNLYGSGLALSAVWPRFREWRLIVFSGVVGTGIAFFDIPGIFLDFLYMQALIFTPVVGIYVCDFYFVRGRRYELADLPGQPPINWSAYMAWALGLSIAFAGWQGLFSLSGIPAIDAALVSALSYLALSRYLSTSRQTV